ncbi:hypothetical protein B0I33_11649 [Prauserella shujinwangii]|uniref:Uncharacterized protein n=1 Tax=Prauserella shujinwangii TaxID=1453103 RepID=A0A2T0LKJ2_9PSEU|nr:hypothetical protein [Prauserella shujinwangii]PRX43316.1 hypothetical protein B0I33_11649 [Prauserella shujinwangii]
MDGDNVGPGGSWPEIRMPASADGAARAATGRGEWEDHPVVIPLPRRSPENLG